MHILIYPQCLWGINISLDLQCVCYLQALVKGVHTPHFILQFNRTPQPHPPQKKNNVCGNVALHSKSWFSRTVVHFTSNRVGLSKEIYVRTYGIIRSMFCLVSQKCQNAYLSNVMWYKPAYISNSSERYDMYFTLGQAVCMGPVVCGERHTPLGSSVFASRYQSKCVCLSMELYRWMELGCIDHTSANALKVSMLCYS